MLHKTSHHDSPSWVCWQEINLPALLGCVMLGYSKLTLVCYPCLESVCRRQTAIIPRFLLDKVTGESCKWSNSERCFAILKLKCKDSSKTLVCGYFYIVRAYFDETKRYILATDWIVSTDPKISMLKYQDQ